MPPSSSDPGTVVRARAARTKAGRRGPRPEPPASRYLWVGNMPNIDNATLAAVFSRCPPEHTAVMRNGRDPRLLGYAFLTYPDVASAAAAHTEYCGKRVAIVDVEGVEHTVVLRIRYSASLAPGYRPGDDRPASTPVQRCSDGEQGRSQQNIYSETKIASGQTPAPTSGPGPSPGPASGQSGVQMSRTMPQQVYPSIMQPATGAGVSARQAAPYLLLPTDALSDLPPAVSALLLQRAIPLPAPARTPFGAAAAGARPDSLPSPPSTPSLSMMGLWPADCGWPASLTSSAAPVVGELAAFL